MKKFFAILAALALVVALAACGGGGGGAGGGGAAPEKDPNVGMYNCVSVSMGDMELGASGEWIELKDNGQMTIFLMDDPYDLEWSLDGTTFTMIEDGTEVGSGTLSDGTLSVDLAGVDCIFVLEGSPAEAEWAAAAPATGGASGGGDAAVYEGQWYGWWAIFNPVGINAEDGDWYDVCAEVTDLGDGSAEMVIWDENLPKDDPLAEFTLSIDEDGRAYVVDGYFLDMQMVEGMLDFSPDDATYSDMLYFTGHYDDGETTFDYSFVIRPWGTIWDDIEVDSPDDLPYGYYDWYMPLLDAGQGAPGTIELNYG